MARTGASTPDDQYDRTTPVLILKMGAQPIHHGTLGVIRSFGRAGVPVYSSREAGASPAARSRYLSTDAIGVLSPLDAELAVAQLKAFQRRVGRPVVTIPVDDNGALFLVDHADVLRPEFLLPAQKPDLLRTAASKADHQQLCVEAGAVTPRTHVIRTAADLEIAGAAVGYPAVVKIAQPWLLPPGFPPIALAGDMQEAAEYRAQLQDQSTADIIIQEYIPDDQAEDWFYHGYCKEGGESVVGFTGRKLRSYPPFRGATSYGLSAINDDVVEISQSLLRKLQYAGIVELEFRFDKRDGQYKLIDFNPRLGAQFQFLRSEAGVDVVRAAHLDLTGRPVPQGRQVEGCAFLSDFTDAAAFSAYWRRGMVSPGQWLRQVVTAEEHAWFALDDLQPFTAACGYSAKRLLSAARRSWRTPSRPSI
ncbi:MAG: hypothetical protein JWQ46_605 [Phenylobacterium sp.]|nr:hypothetical protein [Phenylobacterium sp.]